VTQSLAENSGTWVQCGECLGPLVSNSQARWVILMVLGGVGWVLPSGDHFSPHTPPPLERQELSAAL
jgi:hypothetical protein